MYLSKHIEPITANNKDPKNRPSTAINGVKSNNTNINKKDA